MKKELIAELHAALKSTYRGDLSALLKDVEEVLQTPIDHGAKKVVKKRSPHTPVVIQLSDVSRDYTIGGSVVHALKHATVDIHSGEIVALVGPSGSGKSTMLQLIGGLDTPTSGSIIVAEKELSAMKETERSRYRNQTIGFIFQFFHLQPYLNVAQNVEIPLLFGTVSAPERKKRVADALEAVGLSKYADHRPSQLSGGQQQRVAIARALVNHPQLILADEPTGNLDRANATEVMKLLRKINEERNTTMLIVTHDHFVADFADRSIELIDGNLHEHL